MSFSSCRWMVLLLVVSGLSCKGAGTSGSSAGGASEAELQKQAAPVYEALTAIADNFPDMATLEPKKCDAAPKWMGGLGWNSLMKIIDRKPSDLEKELYDVATLGDVGRIKRLPTKGVTQKYKNRSNYTEAIEEFGKRSHMAILRLGAGKSTRTTGGSTFEGGFVQGWLVVFELANRSPVCHWPVSAKSSEKISVRHGLNDGKTRIDSKKVYAIKQDLKRKLQTALSEAKKQMIPEK